MGNTTLHWFRQDLRLADNPGLRAAMEQGDRLVLLYVLDEAMADNHRPGGAGAWWLHHSLAALADDVAARGSRLVLLRGDASRLLPDLAASLDVSAVHWNRCYEPGAVARDKRLKALLRERGVEVHSHRAALIYEPWEVRTGQGGPYRVFTQFWRRGCPASGVTVPDPVDAPAALPSPPEDAGGETLEDWALLPVKPDWSAGLAQSWRPGEAGAAERLEDFLDAGLAGYRELRNRPDLPNVSRLSPHLHWGEIAPWRVWHAAGAAAAARRVPTADLDHFRTELGWREFSYHLLFHFPDLPEVNLRREFDRFPWRDDRAGLRAWQRGRTGYPIVDAGMRELWHSGYMHNRVRMVVASFLIKDLLIDWREGERWFRDTLVDADLASNSASWQWVAGCGADAAPFFRVFNPVLQGEKFDPDGDYVRKWVPELAGLPDRFLHKPWQADPITLEAAGVTLGKTYPQPVVDHGTARKRALAAFEQIKQKVSA